MNHKTYEFDFVIIGSGLAGLYSAMIASEYGKVAVLTKSSIDESSSFWAQGGIAAVMDRGDTFDDHFKDTLDAGKGLCNKENVKILVSEGKERIQELIDLGMKFDMNDNELLLGLEGGHSKRRILHAGGSETGKKIVQFVIEKIRNNKNIQVFENTFVYKLISDEEVCSGALAFNWKSDTNFRFNSSAIILASGGLSGLFSRSTNPHVSTGDGIALAYNAGAEIMDMEFMQFHPTAFYSETGETFLVSEALRGEGAHLLNEKHERFMLAVDERAELASRDIVSKAIFEEIKNQKNKFVYIDARHIKEDYLRKRFPNIFKNALKFGYNLSEDLLPIAPAAHYTIGGVKTDSNSCTNIKNLYACGETAANGIHGANRLASNSLLECLVFGKRAVKSSIDKRIEKEENSNLIEFSVNNKEEEKFLEIKKITENLLNNSAGISRSAKEMTEAIKEIEILEESTNNSSEYYSIRINNLLVLSKILLKSALIREESRGCHKRVDYTDTNENFLGNNIFKKVLNNRFAKLN